MAEGVLFPDAELAMCNLLRHPLLGGLVVGNEIPNPRPNEFIRVLRTGGPRETLRSEAALVTLEAWAQTKARAIDIMNKARAILGASEGQVFGVRELSGPANLPDPLSATIRYTIGLQVRLRGQSVTV